jgi:hypothetical protein
MKLLSFVLLLATLLVTLVYSESATSEPQQQVHEEKIGEFFKSTDHSNSQHTNNWGKRSFCANLVFFS